MSSWAPFKNSPVKTAAVVVPSPTSSSWVFATSATSFAAGCFIFISSSIVAPSFVIITSPAGSVIILSNPLGPRVVRTASDTARAAMILVLFASSPLVSCVPCFKMMIGCPPFWPCIDILLYQIIK